MSSIACVFPGQGSQHSEMLKTDLVDQSFIDEKIEIVSEVLGADIYGILNDESKLNATSFTQPLLVLSSAIFFLLLMVLNNPFYSLKQEIAPKPFRFLFLRRLIFVLITPPNAKFNLFFKF